MKEFTKLKLVNDNEVIYAEYKNSKYQGYTFILSNSTNFNGYKIPNNLKRGFLYSYALTGDILFDFQKNGRLKRYDVIKIQSKTKLYNKL